MNDGLLIDKYGFKKPLFLNDFSVHSSGVIIHPFFGLGSKQAQCNLSR
jgi:hypothetical protein